MLRKGGQEVKRKPPLRNGFLTVGSSEDAFGLCQTRTSVATITRAGRYLGASCFWNGGGSAYSPAYRPDGPVHFHNLAEDTTATARRKINHLETSLGLGPD